ncbi:MAG: exo-alpha-sialidase [Actinobacteria bacterium]|nr:exo-alpha-sialidase [Actinomycetota bacterium]MBV8395508.1 exo-alpha-sialidase [Actinomycetota bacterium]MBV8599512.1 exo-alpha-sialidase [Actinomycetota bacterium]
MTKTVLLVGTRKGLFLLESEDRRNWRLRGPFCEGWPVYHAVFDPAGGAIYAAAASEWHGAAVWRSADLGETWTHSSAGIAYEDGRRLSKVSNLAVGHGRVLVGVEAPGVFESTDAGETWSLKTTLAGQPGSEVWDDPKNQPPGHLGISAVIADNASKDHWWAIVQGIGLYETIDDGATWTPRNRGLRADWPREHEEVGFCVHKVALTSDPSRMFQQNHVGMHRTDDGGRTWTEITEGLPTEFGFAAVAHPHDRDTFHVIPLDPGHGRTMPDGKACVWRTEDAGATWRRSDRGLPQADAWLGVLREGMAGDGYDEPGYYFGTSTGQVFASADDAASWTEIASYLPAISSVEVATVE